MAMTRSATLGTDDVTDSIFSGNSAFRGGAIANRRPTVNPSYLFLSGSTFSNNVANGASAGHDAGGSGGAIYNEGTASVGSSTFSANQAEDGAATAGAGGGVYNVGELFLAASTISNNFGGGVFAAGPVNVNGTSFPGYVEITNSTFHGNAGSAAISGYGTVHITSSTLSANSVGIGYLGTFTLRNTILANNVYGNCSGGATLTSLDHNISTDASCAAYLSAPNDFPPGTDPGLDPEGLKDNGGPTKTIALELASAAVDAIPPIARSGPISAACRVRREPIATSVPTRQRRISIFCRSPRSTQASAHRDQRRRESIRTSAFTRRSR
jgi:hypothetical protein